MPSLLKAQCLFTHNIGKLIKFIEDSGCTCKLTEVMRTKEQAEIYAKEGVGIANSLHRFCLAADIYIVKLGILQEDAKVYSAFGDYWKKLNPDNRWGGDFERVDAVHFEFNAPEGI
jgi:hypothetical protein